MRQTFISVTCKMGVIIWSIQLPTPRLDSMLIPRAQAEPRSKTQPVSGHLTGTFKSSGKAERMFLNGNFISIQWVLKCVIYLYLFKFLRYLNLCFQKSDVELKAVEGPPECSRGGSQDPSPEFLVTFTCLFMLFRVALAAALEMYLSHRAVKRSWGHRNCKTEGNTMQGLV